MGLLNFAKQAGIGSKLAAITASDTVDFPEGPGYLYPHADGTATILAADDTVARAIPLFAGRVPPFLVKRVLTTGSPPTCTLIYLP